MASKSVLVVELQDPGSVFRLEFLDVFTGPVARATLEDKGRCSVTHYMAVSWNWGYLIKNSGF